MLALQWIAILVLEAPISADAGQQDLCPGKVCRVLDLPRTRTMAVNVWGTSLISPVICILHMYLTPSSKSVLGH